MDAERAAWWHEPVPTPEAEDVCLDCGRYVDDETVHALATYNEVRFACRCGRFLADSAIRHTDHRDDSRYYGVRTEVEWDCARCGVVKGEEWEPQIVVVATRPVSPGVTP